MQDIVRVLRVIEYVGPRDIVEEQIAHSVHGTRKFGNGATVRAATIGSYPEVLESIQAQLDKQAEAAANG